LAVATNIIWAGPDLIAGETSQREVTRVDVVADGVESEVLRSGAFVQDPGFEEGTPNPAWNEFSTNFGTPICSLEPCGTGNGSGPKSGDWWVWFGGFDEFEEGRVSQVVTVPPGEPVLTFGIEIPVCSGNPDDVFEVLVADTQIFEVRGDDPNCGEIGYQPITLDISPVAGQTVTLDFRSETQGDEVTSFFIDDIDIEVEGSEFLSFDIAGTCPGETLLTASGGTPNGSVGIIFSSSPGSDSLGAGPCVGTESGLSNPSLFTLATLDANGELALQRTAPANVCGLFLQLVDAGASCTLSNRAQVP